LLRARHFAAIMLGFVLAITMQGRTEMPCSREFVMAGK
jgi:hypothetical protein